MRITYDYCRKLLSLWNVLTKSQIATAVELHLRMSDIWFYARNMVKEILPYKLKMKTSGGTIGQKENVV